MSKPLILRFDVQDNATAKIQSLDQRVDKLGDTLGDTSAQAKKGGISLSEFGAKAATAAASIYGLYQSVKSTLGVGFDYNAMMEQQLANLQRLIVATSGDISAKGKQLSLTEKYTLANQEAIETLQKLEEINKITPHTLDQTVQIYNAMYASMKNTGASTEQMIELTKRLSIATAGLDFNSVLAGVDGLATGTVDASSDFGRFISSLGLINEALKNTDNVAQLILDRLSQMTVGAGTMEEATSNLQNAWQQLNGEISRPIFDQAKIAINALTKFLNDNAASIVEFAYDVGRVVQLAGMGIIKAYNFTRLGLLKINEAFFAEIEGAKQKTAAFINWIIEQINTISAYFGKDNVFNSIKIDGSDIGAIRAEIALVTKTINDADAATQKLLHDIGAFTYTGRSAQKTANGDSLVAKRTPPTASSEAAKAEKAAQETSLSQWQEYYETLDDYETAWAIQEAQLRSEYYSAWRGNEEQFQQFLAAKKAEYFSSLQSNTETATQMSLSQWSEYYTSLGDLTTAWAIEEAQLRSEYYDAWKNNEEQFQQFIEQRKKEFYDSHKKMTDDASGFTLDLNNKIKEAFSSMSDAIADFVLKGKLQFEDFTRSILADITRLMTHFLLMQAIKGLGFGGLFASANGNVFQGGRLIPFATGGIVTRPTIFPMANGGVGLMGEAGPEAIMPLARGADGKLGVRSQGWGNIINNINITAPDGKLSSESLNQLMTKLAQSMSRAQRRNG